MMQVKEEVKTEKSETIFRCPECGKPVRENDVICSNCRSQLFDN